MLARMDSGDPAQAKFVGSLRDTLFEPWTKNYQGMGIHTTWKKVHPPTSVKKKTVG